MHHDGVGWGQEVDVVINECHDLSDIFAVNLHPHGMADDEVGCRIAFDAH